MVKIRYGKCAGFIVVSLLLGFLSVHVFAQRPGFLSIDCGGKINSTQNGIQWVTDDNYIDVGEKVYTGASNQSYSIPLNRRVFPSPLKKSCYQLPVVPNSRYLLRLSFSAEDYIGFPQSASFSFSIETLGLLASQNVSITGSDLQYFEYILVSSGSLLYVCFVRTSDSEDPFINAIELRTLGDGMYAEAKPGTILYSISRNNCGVNSSVFIRYPQDTFDRFWKSPTQEGVAISTLHNISTNNTRDLPPNAVMQTAMLSSNSSHSIQLNLGSSNGRKTLLVLYFAEINEAINPMRSFYIKINHVKISNASTNLERNYSAVEQTFLSNATDRFIFDVVKTTKNSSPPLINAFEYYSLFDTQLATYAQDIDALNAIKSMFDVKDWISDPCYLIEWQGIHCQNNSAAIRISELNLSAMNLTGPVPETIGQLTALINVSLDNNHLMGSLPNFSNLTMVERLHLQNNNLNGSLPDWLVELKNLKELFIQNNNFSGVIPAQLLSSSLKLNYSGNPYLLTPIHTTSNKIKLGVVLGITLGILFIVLPMILGIAVYRKKSRRKGDVTADPDFSTTIVPTPANARVFTMKDMTAATENFSQKIGRGSFGWVLFGKLPEDKYIAVKLLSSFSREEVHEILNEVDILSRVHHTNLVSLIGYCNESTELMLIYEYMFGGSLSDNLYGRISGRSKLNWKSRVKIALDAARGLEYLHMGCTPKIIHRDVKTANILLDSNLNGKLADFGFSRIPVHGEYSHVNTPVKGKDGYLDPEYFKNHIMTEQSDVYSFGVVLLEIICGRQPVDLNLPAEEVNIIQWVRPYVEMNEYQGKMAEIIDRRLHGNYDMESITLVAKLAMGCVQAEPSSRPSVTVVVKELIKAIKHGDSAGDNASVEESDSELEWGEIN